MKFVALIIVGMVLGGLPFFTNFHKSAAGVIVPLYSYPNDNWDTLIYEKKDHKSIPMVAIINPNNGPGTRNSDYAVGIQKLQHAKILVLGYVPTQYGSRNSSSIISDIDSYKKWYHVNGIFFDEMAHIPGFETYYANLTKYVKTLGMTITVGNPGVDTIPSYVGTVDNIVIYENSGLPSADLFGGWHSNYAKSNFSIIAYNVTNLNSTNIEFLSDHGGFIYATDQTQPNPWDDLSPYLDEMLSALKIDNHNKHSGTEDMD